MLFYSIYVDFSYIIIAYFMSNYNKKRNIGGVTLLYLKLGISRVSHLCFLLFHYIYIFIQFLYERN